MKNPWGRAHFFALPLILLGCATSRPETYFQTVQIGDSKGAVLNKIGNPRRSYFKEDTQRWVYALKTTKTAVPQEKEVWFQKDQVVYVDAWPEKPLLQKKSIEFETVK